MHARNISVVPINEHLDFVRLPEDAKPVGAIAEMYGDRVKPRLESALPLTQTQTKRQTKVVSLPLYCANDK